jgi:actin
MSSSSHGPFSQGLSSMAVNCIERCDMDLRYDLLGSVIVAGGTSMCDGFAQRVHNDLCKGLGMQQQQHQHRTNENKRVKVVADSQRRNAAWIGGSILASLGTFPDMMVTAAEWDESGVRALNKLCM